MKDKLVRIGVFYDGNYFFQVSNFYNYDHERRSRISLAGLHDFIRNHVADAESTEAHYCKIVDAHYFRGRLSAQEASQKGDTLYWERVFDDILMSEGITTHYLPMRRQGMGRHDRGLEIWMALEAYEMALHKQFDVVVLITSESDYVPLVRRLNTIGTRVMMLCWEFETTNSMGQRLLMRSSQDMLKESSYPVLMNEIIDDADLRDEPLISGLFVKQEAKTEIRKISTDDDDVEAFESEVFSIKNGYGFIKYPPNNLFFHYSDITNADFNDVYEGDKVTFVLDINDRGDPVATQIVLLEKG